MSYDIYLYDETAWAHRKEGCPQEEVSWRGERFMDIADGHVCPGDIVWIGNITYNISPMWADALRVDAGVAVDAGGGIRRIMGFDGSREPYGIHRFEGAPGVEAAGPLIEAVRTMESDPERYKAMEPDNGWGSYDGALAFLRRIADECVAYPAYRIHVS
jgi:hypothetical protein